MYCQFENRYIMTEDMIRDYVNDHMLFGGQCGQAYGDSYPERKVPVPPRNVLPLSHSDPAQPAYQTVNGRK